MSFIEKLGINEKKKLQMKIPSHAKNAAKKAIEWEDEYPEEVEGGTTKGWKRAHQIVNDKYMGVDDLKEVASFKRHLSNGKVDSKYKDTPWKDNGHVAVLLWGGEKFIKQADEQIEVWRKEGKLSESKIDKLSESFIYYYHAAEYYHKKRKEEEDDAEDN